MPILVPSPLDAARHERPTGSSFQRTISFVEAAIFDMLAERDACPEQQAGRAMLTGEEETADEDHCL
ncbi:hypothetical protein FJV83_23550 [Mesorhizobium sp. WSM4307]|uniref:hypothetical protein n=1 Tax=unclassified Mesorhizobium TaxID=325217 RepID=UPI00115E4A20|nr:MULTISPECIES: hypothetical protein [unclassified Mesorhizobium]TRC70665.1 hypothetical protein FJV81_35990 [Mesorhizobium sp. WSM4315]TRC82584.1 hypothetical protein FJV83_23550 [Mesorhizobium sp. WSM4307]